MQLSDVTSCYCFSGPCQLMLNLLVLFADGFNLSDRPATLSQTWGAPGRSGSRNPTSQNERSISSVKTVDTWNSKELSPEGDFQRSPYDHQDVSKR